MNVNSVVSDEGIINVVGRVVFTPLFLGPGSLLEAEDAKMTKDASQR